MNRIKIIKRTNLQSSSEREETEPKKAEPAAVRSQAAKVIGNWIDEWRARKMPDARRAFDELFASPPEAA